MSITFSNYQEAKEYALQKYEEGIHADVYKKNNLFIVELKGKLPKIDKRETGGTGIPISYKDTDTPNSIYNKLKELKYPEKRTAEDIKTIAKEEFKKANINNIEIYITNKTSSLMSDATINYPEKEDENYQIAIHPINKYTNESYIRKLIQHEILHIKEEDNI